MVNRRTMAWLAGAVIIGVAVWLFVLPSEEKKVKKRFTSLCGELNKSSGENIINTALRARRVEALFAPVCSVTIGEAWIDGDSEAATLVAQGFQARMQFTTMKLSFSDIKTVFPEKDRARCEVVAKLVGTLSVGTTVDEAREMMWELHKIEGVWRFSSVKQVEVLKK